MRFLVLLVVIGTAASYSIPKGSIDPRPPHTNPNINTEDLEGVHKKSSDPVAKISKVGDNALSDAACDFNSIIAATGDNLVNLVKNAPYRCVNGVFDLSGTNARSACNEQDMTSLASAFYSVTYNYDPAKPANSPGILNLATYMRGCYYVQSYREADVGKYSANLLAQLRYGIDSFLKRPNLEAKNDYHYEIADEVISLISNAHDYLNYVVPLSQLLTKLGNAWKFESSVFIQRAEQGDVVNAIYDIFFRSHYEEAPATAFYCKHPEVPQSLNDFMNKQSGLLNQRGEWVLRNTGGELARFVKYSCLSSQISGYLKAQLAKYTQSNAEKVWASIVQQIDYYTPKDCATYNICTFKKDMEQKKLPYTKTCDKTYMDTFVIRAQSISDAEAAEVCSRLKAQESHFHTLVKDNWQPVTPDTNNRIEVVIFDSVDDYKFYANLIFGIGTDNGGLYLEGDPSKAGNVARYFCYERPKNGKFDVWNLEHEFTHYLDGRYDMKGDFTDESKGRTIWWIEGFAEYAANKNSYPSMVDDCKEQRFTLSTIFGNNYNAGSDRIYHYGYLAARYMFERHRGDVDTILGMFRSGQYSNYESWFNNIVNRYDSDFSSWCKCIANGKPC